MCSPAPPSASTTSGGVHQLSPDCRPDTHHLVRAEAVLHPLDEKREHAAEHQVDLLLMLVCVNAAALARLQHDEVHTEAVNSQLAPERLEALA
jgi:hypothetical protein